MCCVGVCSEWPFDSVGVPQGLSVLFLGHDAEYQDISHYVKMTVHVKGDPSTSGHSRFLTARHTWAKWKNDNPHARMCHKDTDALKQTLVTKKNGEWRVYIQTQARFRTTQGMVS